MSTEWAIDISVIIVNYKSESFLRSCVESISNNIGKIKFEIIIIDNGSEKKIKRLVEKFKQILVFSNKKNVGFSAAINQGILRSKGKFILLLNPDAEIINDAIPKMMKFLDNNDKAGIIGPKVFDSDGKTTQLSCRSFPSFKTVLFNRYSLLTKLIPSNRWSDEYLFTNWNHSQVKKVDWVSGCCMMVRRSMFDEIGVFDTRFFMYNEDVDICMRAYKNGWEVYYVPDAKIIHHIAGSSKHVPQQMAIERHRSIWLFYSKHYKKNTLITFIVMVGILLRMFSRLIFDSDYN